MNILFGLHPQRSWANAARELGHTGFVLESDKVFDSVSRARPDLAILPARPCPNRAVQKALQGVDILRETPQPAIDSNFPRGIVRPELACDIAVVLDKLPENTRYDSLIEQVIESGCKLKLFGSGWHQPQCVGVVPPGYWADIYASAKLVLDPVGRPEHVLRVWAAGGTPCLTVPIKPNWKGIRGLEECPHFWSADPLSATQTTSREVISEHTRKYDTYTSRLNWILSVYKHDQEYHHGIHYTQR